MKITKLSNGGELHKEPNGDKYYYLNNNLHREDGPAIEWGSGYKAWYINGKRQDFKSGMFKNNMKRITKLPNGGELLELPDGAKCWYLNGKYHREDGPALEYPNGDKIWYLNGKCHREDGPAIVYANGDKYCYLNGKYQDSKSGMFKVDENIDSLPSKGLADLKNCKPLDIEDVDAIYLDQDFDYSLRYEIYWIFRYETHCQKNNIHYEPFYIVLSKPCSCSHCRAQKRWGFFLKSVDNTNFAAK
jgi:hypothetical protein